MSRQKAVIAPIYSRFKAFIIDMFVIFMPILYIVTYVVLGSKEEFQHNQGAILICNVLFGLILSLFFTLLAQSPGYKAQKIYLVNLKTGRKVGFFMAVLRYICFVLAGFSTIGIVLCFFRKDKLNLHDILTQTAAVSRKI
ncbi:RDD family protein [Campylobacter sp. faydin G-24]|uniref:RDD family protein n=1 Tax=Campylobacter anatolicus TaxID=2829105 RepID=A0ABS5HIT6_9BACT|nr:RDD family protein [Campylobacter anatolicus]MBR8464185.1 RDD family protein [Campylobacter anatolicus]MBR8466091.1 RDD family protein [Campylobacter anatolicus]